MGQVTFRKTLTDKRLEDLSDKIRKGIPVAMHEAIEVIEYQQMLRKNKLSLTDKILNFFKIK
jgi:predicted solute-binding protein